MFSKLAAPLSIANSRARELQLLLTVTSRGAVSLLLLPVRTGVSLSLTMGFTRTSLMTADVEHLVCHLN